MDAWEMKYVHLANIPADTLMELLIILIYIEINGAEIVVLLNVKAVYGQPL